jgi:hypothetical protein
VGWKTHDRNGADSVKGKIEVNEFRDIGQLKDDPVMGIEAQA